MAHVRVQLSTWVVSALLGSDDADNRVYLRRALPLAKTLPATFLVSIANERSADVSGSGTQERVADLRVIACVKADSDDAEDILARMATFAEETLAGDPTFGGLARTYEYQSTEFSVAGDGDRTCNVAAMTFAVTYYTRRTDPQTAL